MLVATAFSHVDARIAVELFDWIRELEGGEIPERHRLLLVAAKGLPADRLHAVQRAAGRAFKRMSVIVPRQANEVGWPVSANHLFRTAYDWVRMNHKEAWFWLEPDCIPLAGGWLEALEQEYRRCKKPFMGVIYQRPFAHLTGCAIYPANIEAYNPECLKSQDAWDCVEQQLTIPHTHHTKLIQHEWGNISNNIAPTFPNQRSLRLVRAGAKLFHRNKDGTLVRRLIERRENPWRCRWQGWREPNLGNGFQQFSERRFDLPKPAVKGVMLAAIDGRSDCRPTLRALIRAGDQMSFEQCVLFSPFPPESLPGWIRHVTIPPLDLSGYNRFCLRDLHQHVGVGHCLVIQADSGINNPAAWEERWRQYDYIGAPWPEGWAWDQRPELYQRVGNSGFCLRSKRFLEATSKLPSSPIVWHGQRLHRCVDDVIACVNYRAQLEHERMRFAPVAVASKFAFEQETREARKLNGQFGFHLKHA